MFDELFGNGKLEIRLPKLTFGAGEAIDGDLSYALDAPMKARALVVGLRAKQRIRTRAVRNGSVSVEDTTKTLYEFKNELSGEKTYSRGDASFHLAVPHDVHRFEAQAQAPDGLLGDIARAASFLSGESRSPVEWEVFAVIDIPWKVNVKKAQAITVTEGAPPAGPPVRIRIG